MCVFFPFSLRSSPPLPPRSRPAFSLRERRSRPGAESRAECNGVQPRTGGDPAHGAPGKGRGPGAGRWRGGVGVGGTWRGVRGPCKPCGRRAPRPLSAGTWGCLSGAASFGSRTLPRPEPGPPLPSSPTGGTPCLPAAAVRRLRPRAARSPPPPGCQRGGLPPRRPAAAGPAPPAPLSAARAPLNDSRAAFSSLPFPSDFAQRAPRNFQPPDKFVCVCGCFFLLLVLFFCFLKKTCLTKCWLYFTSLFR